MRGKWLLWVLLAFLVYWLSPYLLGGLLGALYAGVAVPIYSQICLDSPVTFLKHPLSSEDYQVFLLGEGCTLQEVRDKKKKEAEEAEKECGDNPVCHSIRGIGPGYRGMHRYFNDDFIGSLLTYLVDLFADHFQGTFIPSTLGTADGLVLGLKENVLFRALYCIGYAGLVAFLGYLLSNFAHDVYARLKRVWSN